MSVAKASVLDRLRTTHPRTLARYLGMAAAAALAEKARPLTVAIEPIVGDPIGDPMPQFQPRGRRNGLAHVFDTNVLSPSSLQSRRPLCGTSVYLRDATVTRRRICMTCQRKLDRYLESES